MRKQTQIDLVQRLVALVRERTTTYLDETWTIPTSHYCDPERARQERAVLARHPIIAARCSQLTEPGEYLSVTLLGLPLLLVRREDGTVRALGNVCRHRGTQLVPAGVCGIAKTFTCPYHGWTYTPDGSLRAIPHHFDSFVPLDKSAFGLVSFPAAERHGFIWVVATPGEGPLDLGAYLGAEVDAEMDAHGIAGWELAREEIFDEPMNWKVVADGILDPYHPLFVHPDTVGPYINNNVYVFDRLSEYAARLTMSKKSIVDADPAELADNAAKYVFANYAFLPNTFMVFQSRHFEVWTVLPHPSDPGRSLTHIRVLVSDAFPDRDAKVTYVERNWELFMKVAYGEDWGVGRRAQAGLASGVMPDSVVGRNEAAVHFLHSFLSREIGDDGAGLRPMQ